MKHRNALIILCILSCPACTSDMLRHNTLNQTATLPDLQHQVVLTNLATFAYDRYAIPFHATPSDGTTQIQDNGSITSQLLNATSRTLTLGLSRTAVDQWSMTPVTESVELRILRAAYRRAFDPQVDLYYPDTDLANDLAHELKKQTTTVDDLRTTNQIGNGGLQAYVPAGNSSMTSTSQHNGFAGVADLNKTESTMPDREDANSDTVPKALDTGLGKIADGLTKIGDGVGKISKTSQQGKILLTNKTEPDIVGFNNDSIAKFMFEADSVLSSNDDKIILEDESIGRFPGSLDSQLLHIPLPEWTAEKIELPIDNDHLLGDYRVRLSDPSRPIVPLDISFLDLLPKDFKLQGFNMDDTAKAQTVLAIFRKMKERIDSQGQKYYGSIGCVSSLAIEDFNYNTNTIRKLSLVVSFPARLARNPGKLQGLWGPHPIASADYLRYMATTPLVAELRRQVAEVERTLMKLPSGWLKVSRDKHDVPKNACHKICTKDCNGPIYAWVCSEDKPAFEEFTINVLELSTVMKPVNISGSTGVKFTPGSAAPTASPGK